jgi:hypothetical protein
MAKTQRRLNRRRNKSRSLKGGTKASSKSHIASAAAPASSLAVIKRTGESSAAHLARVLAQVSAIAKSAAPNGITKVQKTLTEGEKAIIAMQRKINARAEEFASAAHARPKHSNSSHAAYIRAAAAARGIPPQ